MAETYHEDLRSDISAAQSKLSQAGGLVNEMAGLGDELTAEGKARRTDEVKTLVAEVVALLTGTGTAVTAYAGNPTPQEAT